MKRRADNKASVYTDADKTIVTPDDEKESYTTYKTKFYDHEGKAYKPGEDIDEGELSSIKKKGTTHAHVLKGKEKLYLNPVSKHNKPK